MEEMPQLITHDQAFFLLLIGTVVPVGGYIFNKLAPWDDETIKGLAQVVLSGIAGYLYMSLVPDAQGFINLSEGAFSSVIASLFAHNLLGVLYTTRKSAHFDPRCHETMSIAPS